MIIESIKQSPYGEIFEESNYINYFEPGSVESFIPNISSLVNADPTLLETIVGDGELKGKDLIGKYVAEMGIKDFFYGSRALIRESVQNSGIASRKFFAVNEIFKTDDLFGGKAADSLSRIFSSGFSPSGIITNVLDIALDTIGAIPIVGWVVKAVAAISRVITQGAIAIQNAKGDASRARYALSMLSVPYGATEFSEVTNDAYAQHLYQLLKTSPDDIMSPAFERDPNGIFSGFACQGVSSRRGEEFNQDPGTTAEGWIVHPSTNTRCLGFVPGTPSITRSYYLAANQRNVKSSCSGGHLRDLGSLYPTAEGIATGWWSQVNEPGPLMYTVRPMVVRKRWENYIESMFILAQELMSGWSILNSGIPFSNEFHCNSSTGPESEMTGAKGLGGCTNWDVKGHKKKTIPEKCDGHHKNFYASLCALYFGIGSKDFHALSRLRNGLPRGLPVLKDNHSGFYFDHGKPRRKYARPDNLDFSESVPAKALETLYGNQFASLKSLQCMYVNGDDTNTFPAFKDKKLKDHWEQSVRDVFESGSWRSVATVDIPQGQVRNAFENRVRSAGISNVEHFNRPCLPGESPGSSDCGPTMAKGHFAVASPMPEDPSLPNRPTLNGAVLADFIAPGGSGGGKRKSSAMPLVLGAGALGFMMMKRGR